MRNLHSSFTGIGRKKERRKKGNGSASIVIFEGTRKLRGNIQNWFIKEFGVAKFPNLCITYLFFYFLECNLHWPLMIIQTFVSNRASLTFLPHLSPSPHPFRARRVA